MESVPAELYLKVVSQVVTVEDLVNLGLVSTTWREMGEEWLEGWLLRQRVGEQLSCRELGWVRRQLDGWFYCVVRWGAPLD